MLCLLRRMTVQKCRRCQRPLLRPLRRPHTDWPAGTFRFRLTEVGSRLSRFIWVILIPGRPHEMSETRQMLQCESNRPCHGWFLSQLHPSRGFRPHRIHWAGHIVDGHGLSERPSHSVQPIPGVDLPPPLFRWTIIERMPKSTVIGAVLTLRRSLPLYPDERTSSDRAGSSV